MFETFATRGLVPILLRLVLAVVFIHHGLEKVHGENMVMGTRWDKIRYEKESKSAEDPETVRQPLPAEVQAAVAWGELLGGIAIALGFLTRFAAAGIIIIMAGAIWIVHGSQGFALQHGGFEYNFVLIVIAACLVLMGGGMISLDRVLKLKRRT